ncbi:hypothetical protein [Yimella sp. cx-51]|uniref:hypothetical protein n=1 Tax=Yimella sp. cx-51 TaxID=2770551 RepID=UPI00165DBB28|nr:hypothetical protein [Yimella sp. cx-51]MBC9956771.1 hypothetical protein [Yimella sp. cx-51]MBD2759198.1 hypothetical protein [Yimella sp. cx-573]QTH39004.1 hypothetical protein J5M86_05090 [Yimella sp. cx-51]
MSDLHDLGADSKDAGVWVRARLLHRVRRGAYVDAARWPTADPTGRSTLQHRASVHALTSHPGNDFHAAGASAAVLHGLPLIEPFAGTHLARGSLGPSERNGDVVVQTWWGPESLGTAHGLPVLTPAATVASLATLRGVEPGVVALDAALHTPSPSPCPAHRPSC